ncbi:MAG: hypothetical protein NZZ60_08320 [Bacteroidia bacterium]|nr:hypothetical protein [Bacteroidia bacterium]MCX7651964.1 hypothetical protein [Bacteroidia bacterium]MDW8416115.1 hypothetical protein [Bacteroidia bacterium]
MWRCWLLCSILWAQGLLVEPLPHGLSVAPLLHSYGWGLSVYVPKWKSSYSGTFWIGDLTSYRSKYEGRTRSAYKDQGGKDYVFGKLYYAYLFQLIWGYQYIVAPRTIMSPLQVSLQAGIGPSFALLKPYYLEIAVPISSTQAIIQVDTYDPLRHTYNDIVGEADFYLGFDKLRITPGLVGQLGSMIDVGKEAGLIRSFAIGVRAQAFTLPVKTMHQYPSRSMWVSGYLAFYIGNAWK